MRTSAFEKRRLRSEKRMRKDFVRLRKDGEVQLGNFVDTLNDMRWYQRLFLAVVITSRKLTKAMLTPGKVKETP